MAADPSPWNFQQVLGAIESALKSLAILTGGVWAFYTFVLKRERFPKAKLQHSFTLFQFGEGRKIIRVDLRVDNIGAKLLRVRSVTTRLQQITPLAIVGGGARFEPHASSANPEIDWPTIQAYQHFFRWGEREIEPGENDTFQFDYEIPADVAVVQAYSYVSNPAKWLPPWKRKCESMREIGWNATDVFALKGE